MKLVLALVKGHPHYQGCDHGVYQRFCTAEIVQRRRDGKATEEDGQDHRHHAWCKCFVSRASTNQSRVNLEEAVRDAHRDVLQLDRKLTTSDKLDARRYEPS